MFEISELTYLFNESGIKEIEAKTNRDKSKIDFENKLVKVHILTWSKMTSIYEIFDLHRVLELLDEGFEPYYVRQHLKIEPAFVAELVITDDHLKPTKKLFDMILGTVSLKDGRWKDEKYKNFGLRKMKISHVPADKFRVEITKSSEDGTEENIFPSTYENSNEFENELKVVWNDDICCQNIIWPSYNKMPSLQNVLDFVEISSIVRNFSLTDINLADLNLDDFPYVSEYWNEIAKASFEDLVYKATIRNLMTKIMDQTLVYIKYGIKERIDLETSILIDEKVVSVSKIIKVKDYKVLAQIKIPIEQAPKKAEFYFKHMIQNYNILTEGGNNEEKK